MGTRGQAIELGARQLSCGNNIEMNSEIQTLQTKLQRLNNLSNYN